MEPLIPVDGTEVRVRCTGTMERVSLHQDPNERPDGRCQEEVIAAATELAPGGPVKQRLRYPTAADDQREQSQRQAATT
jgi:hypothetical protein